MYSSNIFGSRRKLSHDPNNTAWSRSTDRFGHKILTGLGWKPGTTLGAKDAAHSKHYTSASTSHLRLLLKDDNLGLGAKRGNVEGENFGLDGLQSLLGRLNGKSEEVLQKEEEARRDVRLVMYAERRFGALRFVSGGFLEGDNIEQTVHRDAENSETDALPTNTANDVDPTSRKRKRRNIEQLDIPPNFAPAVDMSRKKRSSHVQQPEDKEGKRRTKHASLEPNSNTEEKRQYRVTQAQTPPATQEREVPSTAIETDVDRKRRKAEKKACKEAKRLPSVKSLEKRVGADMPAEDAAARETSAKAKWDGSDQEVTHQTKLPNAAIQVRGLHLVRQRYIRQKQMASMDEQALREVSINHFQRTHSYANFIA
jgi:Pin2-interacting protein X1